MANLKQVTPTLIGQTQTAQRSVRMVSVPNTMDGAGEMIKGATRGFLSMAGAFGDLLRERDEAKYRATLNDAIAEADRRMHEEVFSRDGFSAEGISEVAANIYAEVGSKYSKDLSGESSRRFSEYWGARRNNQAASVMRFERTQLQGAQITANKAIQKSEIGNYTATLEPGALDRAKRAYDDNVRLANGGHLMDRTALTAFQKDVNDGDGKIRLADGRVLRIVEDGEQAGPGTISKRQLKEIERRFVTQVSAYESGLQNLYDLAHAQVVEQYLKDDRFTDASDYLDRVSSAGYAHGISRSVLGECRGAVNRKREVSDISSEAAGIIRDIQSRLPKSARYGGMDQDRLYAEVRADIVSRYTGAKWKRGQKLLQILDLNYRVLSDRQKAALTADTVSALTQMQQGGLSLPAQGDFIDGMEDGPLKMALQKAHGRRVESYNNNTDPVFLAEQERRLNGFKLALSTGRAELDGVSYDLSNQEQLKAYVLNLGFTAKNQKRAADYINNSRSRIDAWLAARVLADLLEMDDPAAALGHYPQLLSQLDLLKGSNVIEPSQMSNWLKANIASIISGEAWHVTMNGFEGTLRGEKGAVRDAYRRGGGVAKRKQQLISDWRRFKATAALNRGDSEGAQRALTTTPSDRELSDFAERSGYQFNRDKGYWYRRGGK